MMQGSSSARREWPSKVPKPRGDRPYVSATTICETLTVIAIVAPRLAGKSTRPMSGSQEVLLHILCLCFFCTYKLVQGSCSFFVKVREGERVWSNVSPFYK